MNGRLILYANAIVVAHVAFLIAMVTSPLWAPWWLITMAGAVVIALNWANRWHCPWTSAEYRLRRRATRRKFYKHPNQCLALDWDTHIVTEDDMTIVYEDYIPARSMIGRLIAIPAHLCDNDWYPSERTVGIVTRVALVLLPLLAVLRQSLI